MNAPQLIALEKGNISELLALIQSFHNESGISSQQTKLIKLLQQILQREDLGRIWLIQHQNMNVGYIAVSFGFSLEFGGFDAFIDELFVLPEYRGLGIGGEVLEKLKIQLENMGRRAVHLEVLKMDLRARSFYEDHAFKLRQGYHLMSALL